jgi:hypothetical protein
MFTWCRRRRSSICLIYLVCSISDIWYSMSPRGAPAWFYICNRARVYKDPSQIRIGIFLLRLQVIFESLCRSTSLMGWTRYTNPQVPEGHIHVSSPRDSIWVADSGWVSKLQSLTSFILWLLQSSISSILLILQFLQTSTSSNFDFFKLRFLQSSTSLIFDFLKTLISSIFDFIYLRLLEICSPDGSKFRVYFLVLATDNELKIFLSRSSFIVFSK